MDPEAARDRLPDAAGAPPLPGQHGGPGPGPVRGDRGALRRRRVADLDRGGRCEGPRPAAARAARDRRDEGRDHPRRCSATATGSSLRAGRRSGRRRRPSATWTRRRPWRSTRPASGRGRPRRARPRRRRPPRARPDGPLGRPGGRRDAHRHPHGPRAVAPDPPDVPDAVEPRRVDRLPGAARRGVRDLDLLRVLDRQPGPDHLERGVAHVHDRHDPRRAELPSPGRAGAAEPGLEAAPDAEAAAPRS